MSGWIDEGIDEVLKLRVTVIMDDGVTEVTEVADVLGFARLLCGPVDVGSARRGLQYAVGEWSLMDGSQPNPVASEFLGRPIAGHCVIWGYDEAGDSTSFDIGDHDGRD